MNNTQPTISLAEIEAIIDVLDASVNRLIEEATAIAETDPMEAIYSTFFTNPKDFA